MATRSTNQTFASCTISAASALPFSSVGSNGLGTAFNGPLFTSSTFTPSVRMSSETSAHWKMTPTEPVMVLP